MAYTREHLDRAQQIINEWQVRVEGGTAPVVTRADRTVELRRHSVAEAISQGFDVVGVPAIGGAVLAMQRINDPSL